MAQPAEQPVPVLTLMFGTTMATIYLSYVFLLGVTHPWAAFKVVTKADPSELGASHPSHDEVMFRIHERRYKVWIAGSALSAVCAEVCCMFLIVSALIEGSIDLSNHLMCANYMGRVFVGSFSPNLKFTVRLNIWTMPLCVICSYVRQGDERDLSMLPLFILNEVISVTFMAVVLGQLNYLTIKQEESTMELEENVKKQDLHIKETEAILNAAKSLLAVMCDCCEQLSHDWRIVHPSNQVLELLRLPNIRKEKHSCLSLMQYIAIEDQDRFTTFIGTSHVNAPSSLHLEMKDFHGALFDVQLCHMPVPSLLTEERQHLVGIIKKEPREPVRRRTQVIPSIPEDATLHEDMNGNSSSSDDMSYSRCSHRLSNLMEESFSPGDSFWNLKHANVIDHVRISLDLHTGPAGYSVQKLLITFKEGTSDGPKLFSFLKRRYKVLVEDWLQEHVNSWYYGASCDEKCLGTKLSIPRLGHLVIGEMNVVDIQSYQDQFTVDLEMKNFVSD